MLVGVLGVVTALLQQIGLHNLGRVQGMLPFLIKNTNSNNKQQPTSNSRRAR